MISPDKLFENLFDSPLITDTRLAAFAQDCLNRLTAGNTGSRFATMISALAPALLALQNELGDVDTSITVQRGKTQTVNQAMTDFKQTMRDKEGVIANAVGGFNSPAYLEFYPHGLNEYGSATKTQMPVLVNRVNAAAVKYATQLGTPLATILQGYEASWLAIRNAQEQQKGNVDDNRTTRSSASINVELVLTKVVHFVAGLFPGDVHQCSSFFDFSLLYPQAHGAKAEKFTGDILKSQTAVAINRSFTDSVELKLTTVSDSASLLAYLGATSDAQPNGTGVEVKPTRSRYLKMSELGNESGTFLLIKNLSDVNDASYLLEVKG